LPDVIAALLPILEDLEVALDTPLLHHLRVDMRDVDFYFALRLKVGAAVFAMVWIFI